MICALCLLLVLAAPASSNAPVRNKGSCEGTSEEDAGSETQSCMLQAKGGTLHSFATDPLGAAQMKTASLQLSSKLHKIASRSAGHTKELLHSFRLCGQCNQFERFGELHDGGYLTCMDGLKGNLRAAYSMGVEHHDKWSDDVTANFGVPVSTGCSSCKFFKKCIVSEDNHEGSKFPPEKLWTLREALENTGQADAPNSSLLSKMDIEGAEWPVYEVAKPDILAKFKQIIVEFHSLQHVEKHQQYLAAMQHLLGTGFQVTHLHGNNCCGMVNFETERVPKVIEVTFVQQAAKRQECLSAQEYLPQDHMNLPRKIELPMVELD